MIKFVTLWGEYVRVVQQSYTSNIVHLARRLYVVWKPHVYPSLHYREQVKDKGHLQVRKQVRGRKTPEFAVTENVHSHKSG